MIYNSNVMRIAAVFMAVWTKLSSGNQPSYQVSLFVHWQPQQPPIHVCNGAIVQSRLILTTASCLHYKISPNTAVVPLAANMISVIGGASAHYHEELTLYAADIFVADRYNYTTGANDLALLRLNGILPLDTRNDINWITLEDGREYDGPCLANFFERNSGLMIVIDESGKSKVNVQHHGAGYIQRSPEQKVANLLYFQLPQGVPNYIQSAHMPILDSESCQLATEKPIERKNDICSLYYISSDLNCNPLEAVQNYNEDRGTGLVCGSKLIGLLSTILPWQNANDCKDRAFRAYYTAVQPHISWIFNIITKEDLKLYREGAYISSSPYAGETNAFLETLVAETVTSTVQTIPANFQSTGSSVHQNSSATMHERINCKLLFGFLGVIYVAAYPY